MLGLDSPLLTSIIFQQELSSVCNKLILFTFNYAITFTGTQIYLGLEARQGGVRLVLE